MINPQAEELNQIIKEGNQAVYNLLSNKGKSIFFPKKGILSQSADAKGKKINATIGAAIEDDSTPMRLATIADKIKLDPKDVFPYAPSFGKPELRKVWKEMIQKKNPSLSGNISLPVVTNALTHGLSMVGYMFINPDDSIIMPDRYWGNYNLIFKNAYGAQIDTFKTFDGSGLDTDSLRDKLKAPGKKVLLLNFPNNPTGYTPTTSEAGEISDIIHESAKSGNEIVVICDDAYFGLVYKDGIYKESMFSKLSDLHENVLAIKLDGATKEDYAWGFRVGFITYGGKGLDEKVYEALEAKTAGAVRGNISNAPHLSQSLVLQGFKSSEYEKEKEEKFRILKSRFEKVEEVLSEKKYQEYFKPLPFNSGYFMCVELNEGLDAEKIRQTLLDEYDTGVIAVGNMLRIAFSGVAEDNIRELFENMYNACR